MPHADEGRLHAYLDGALHAEDPEGARALERHLEACGDCRALLEFERAVRDEASDLLAAARPEAAAAPPPWEEILHRAGRGEPASGHADATRTAGAPAGAVAEDPTGRMQRPRARGIAWLPAGRRLAWAASVVLAVGVGWWSHAVLGVGPFDYGRTFTDEESAVLDMVPGGAAREGAARSRYAIDAGAADSLVRDEAFDDRAASEERAADADAAGADAAGADAIGAGAPGAATPQDALEREAAPGRAVLPSRPAPGDPANESRARAATPGDTARSDRRAAAARANDAGNIVVGPPSTSEPADTAANAGAREVPPRTLARALAPARAAAPPDVAEKAEPAAVDSAEPAAAEAAEPTAGMEAGAGGEGWTVVDLTEARALLGRPPVGVPGADLIEVAWGEGGRTLRVTQRLVTGERVDFYQWNGAGDAAGAGPDDARLADAVEGDALVGRWRGGASLPVVRTDGLLVAGSGPVDAAVLRELLENLEPVPSPDEG
jgi:hypothetical protein